MNSQRGLFISGLVLGVGTGLLLSHFTLARSQQPDVRVSATFPLKVHGAPLDVLEDQFIAQSSDPSPYFEADTEELTEPLPDLHPFQNALAVETASEIRHPPTDPLLPVLSPLAENEPEPLKVGEAVPLTKNSLQDQETIRGIIDIELSHLPEEKRQVWYEALKDVNKSDVPGILRMWVMFGGPIPGAPGGLGLSLQPESVPSSAHVAPPQNALNKQLGEKAARLLKSAEQLVRLNRLLQNTPGYTPQFPCLVGDSLEELEVVAVNDFQNFRHVVTGFPLDLAIKGAGFFEVVDQDGERFLTRMGRFTLDENNHIVLRVGERTLTLSELSLDQGWNQPGTQFVVDRFGQVQLLTSKSRESNELDYRKVGSISVKLPVSYEHLKRSPDGLFQLSDEGWDQLMTLPELAGIIESGSIEMPGQIDESGDQVVKLLEQLAREISSGTDTTH
ncbi:hypothetical protein SH661x_004267 [Planctomicrobium sp. SH661]|uniref:hypothetical protein n=1 Tax=Planctomicrobium sp. SH661 TaxID=3448124 RepID=UPI003F5C62B5